MFRNLNLVCSIVLCLVNVTFNNLIRLIYNLWWRPLTTLFISFETLSLRLTLWSWLELIRITRFCFMAILAHTSNVMMMVMRSLLLTSMIYEIIISLRLMIRTLSILSWILFLVWNWYICRLIISNCLVLLSKLIIHCYLISLDLSKIIILYIALVCTNAILHGRIY